MNILIFSHTSDLGGSERALLDLVSLLTQGHQVAVMLPTSKGILIEKLRVVGAKCGVIPIAVSLPTPFTALLKLCDPEMQKLIEHLKLGNYDLIICNTIATLHGMLIAKELNIPCITYAHEYLAEEPDLIPHGCTVEFYMNEISALSSHILCASEYVKSALKDPEKCSVLYPFTPYLELEKAPVPVSLSGPVSLLVIGTKSNRKNAHFAITVAKALRLRGNTVNLHIIGSENSGSFKLRQQMAIRAEKNVFIHSHLEDPFDIPGRKINLVCSHSEPFGLTIPESLARGIPVVGSKSGGPEEILPAELIFSDDSVDECVRTIEKVIKNYDQFTFLARKRYEEIAVLNNSESRKKIVTAAINQALYSFKASPVRTQLLNVDDFKKVLSPPITFDQVVENIVVASKNSPRPMSSSQVCALVEGEIKNPGSAVMSDIHEFDVVPFGHSENMNRLYKNGLGLASELLANIKNIAKQYMLAYIVLRLKELQAKKHDLKILSLGDGLGVDSIILATYGFNVDYIDFDQSLMAKCADLNFKTAMKNVGDSLSLRMLTEASPPYDAIISLEVIEHVPDPHDFLKYVSSLLLPGGLFFISECFDGIYDEWPTHLYSNEKYASTLPVMAAPFFKLEDINTHPLGKPYLFSKNMTDKIQGENLKFLVDTAFFHTMGIAQNKIGY